MRNDIARMLREDAAQTQRVLDGKTPDLAVRGIGPMLIQHLLMAANELDS